MGKGGDPAAGSGVVAPQLLAWLACWLAGSKGDASPAGGHPARAEAEGERSSDAAPGASRAIWAALGIRSRVRDRVAWAATWGTPPQQPPGLAGFY